MYIVKNAVMQCKRISPLSVKATLFRYFGSIYAFPLKRKDKRECKMSILKVARYHRSLQEKRGKERGKKRVKPSKAH